MNKVEEVLALDSQVKNCESQIRHHESQTKIWRTERRKLLQKIYRLEQKSKEINNEIH